MAVNDTVRLDVVGTANGQQHIHTLHFRYQEVTSTEQGLIDSWQSIGRTAYRGLFATTDPVVTLLRATQVCGSVPLRAPVEEAELAATQFGTVSWGGDPAPSWLAAVISWRTASAGRSRRGRSYLGGVYEAAIVGNNITSTYSTKLATYRDALLAAYTVGGTVAGYKLVVYSRKLASVPGTQCQDSSTLITSAVIDDPLGSMKSRKPGSGS